MKSIKLIHPGIGIKLANTKKTQEVRGMLRLLENCLIEADIALNYYLQTRKKINMIILDKKSLEDEIKLIKDSKDNKLEKIQKIVELTNVKHKKRIDNPIPRQYCQTESIMHARSFLYAIDMIRKILHVIYKESGEMPNFGKEIQNFDTIFGTVNGLRDSSAHKDERIKGEAYGKKIKTKPFNNKYIQAPKGGFFSLESFMGDTFTSTMENGEHGELEISEKNLNNAIQIVQNAINCLPREGIEIMKSINSTKE